jgi:hypothetical protein
MQDEIRSRLQESLVYPSISFHTIVQSQKSFHRKKKKKKDMYKGTRSLIRQRFGDAELVEDHTMKSGNIYG